MPAQIHKVPQCPKCKCYDNRVVSTSYPLAGDCDIVRRRCCNICNHRWYTGQNYEFNVKVKFNSREISWFPVKATRINA